MKHVLNQSYTAGESQLQAQCRCVSPPSMAVSTRKSEEFPLFERVCDLKDKQLPTYEDLIKCILHRKRQVKIDAGGKDPSISTICRDVACDVVKIYNIASIPPLTEKRIAALLKDYHAKYQNLMKSYKNRINVKSYKDKLDGFLNDSKKLFDFASCKCNSFESCTCSKDKKVPAIERSFLLDQRSDRNMFVGSKDVRTSNVLRKREERKMRHEEVPIPSTSAAANQVQMLESDDTLSAESTDDEFIPPKSSMKRICFDNTACDESKMFSNKKKEIVTAKSKSLPFFAEACDRVGVSDRGAALLSTSLLEDFGVVKRNSLDNVIDRYV